MNLRNHALRASAVLLAGLLGGCGTNPPTPQCSSSNCEGCCDGDTCKPGVATDACGSSGGACTTCASLQTCTSGSCQAVTLSGPGSGQSIEIKDAIFYVTVDSPGSDGVTSLVVTAGNQSDFCTAVTTGGGVDGNRKFAVFLGERPFSKGQPVPQWRAGTFTVGDNGTDRGEYFTTNAMHERSDVWATSGTFKIEELTGDDLTANFDYVLPSGAIQGRVKARRCAAKER